MWPGSLPGLLLEVGISRGVEINPARKVVSGHEVNIARVRPLPITEVLSPLLPHNILTVGHYVFLDEITTADCAIEVTGHDLSDLFVTVGRAVAEIMVDPRTIPVTTRREIVLTASALDLLLFDWIAELIFVKDSESLIFTETTVAVAGPPECRLTARVAGGPIDRARTILRADVKAPTLHHFALERHPAGWSARIVLDV